MRRERALRAKTRKRGLIPPDDEFVPRVPAANASRMAPRSAGGPHAAREGADDCRITRGIVPVRNALVPDFLTRAAPGTPVAVR